MKKIVFVIDSLGCGGAEKSLVSLLPLLNKSKYEVHLWMLSRGGAFEALIPSDIIIEKAPSYSICEKFVKLLFHMYYSIYYRIQKKYGKNAYPSEVLWRCCGSTFKGLKDDYDVAIAYGQGLSTYVTISTIKAKKYIGWVNADMFSTGYDILFNLRFYDDMSYIVPVSEKLKNIMQANLPQYNNRYRCVYDILNPGLIQKMSEDQVFDIPNDNRIKLLTVARFVPPKGHELLIQAAIELKRKNIPFLWMLIGVGIRFNEIQALVRKEQLEDSVIFMGLRTNPYPYMKTCDVYVQTSIHEGFGITISEAKILNKPIVSTDFDTVYDQLTPEKNGIIVAKNGKAIADGILRVLNDKQLRLKIVTNLEKETNTKYLTEVAKVEMMLDE